MFLATFFIVVEEFDGIVVVVVVVVVDVVETNGLAKAESNAPELKINQIGANVVTNKRKTLLFSSSWEGVMME